MFYDAHTHLNAEQLYPERQTYLQKFIDVGGKGCVNIGVNHERNLRAIEIANASADLYGDSCVAKAAIGIHPGEVSYGHITNDADIHKAIASLQHLHDIHTDHIVAIGECGIDAHYEGYTEGRSLQQALFFAQATLARERNLPIVIHSRDHFNDTYEVIQEFPELKIYFHCRGYTPEDISILQKTCPQLRIGFCGNTTYPKANQLRESLSYTRKASNSSLLANDSEGLGEGLGVKMLLETDAPYLSPQEKRGTTNEPAHLPFLYQAVSEYLEVDMIPLQKQLHDNFFLLYT